MKIPEVIVFETRHRPGVLASVLNLVAEAGLLVENLNAVERTAERTRWELTVEFDEAPDRSLLEAISALPNISEVGTSDRVFNLHRGGKIEMVSRLPLTSLQELRDAYTPGVARVALAIQREPELAREYTNLYRTVAIVTNGTRVLGLGDVGPVAGLPVMEGKAALFHALAGISGIPILMKETDPSRIVDAIETIAPSFGAIQLEDIRTPECFAIEDELIRRLDRPVLHDDQHGTGVVALVALINATSRVGLDLKTTTIGQIGLGAAGMGIARLLLRYGATRVLGADRNETAIARLEAAGGTRSTLDEIMAEAQVVVAATGVRGLIAPEQVREGQVILALTNPDPEIEPAVARAQGAAFAADGGSVNNVLGFPGLFRGALDARATQFTDEMLIAAAQTLAGLAGKRALVPNSLDRDVHRAVAAAVAAAATG